MWVYGIGSFVSSQANLYTNENTPRSMNSFKVNLTKSNTKAKYLLGSSSENKEQLWRIAFRVWWIYIVFKKNNQLKYRSLFGKSRYPKSKLINIWILVLRELSLLSTTALRIVKVISPMTIALQQVSSLTITNRILRISAVWISLNILVAMDILSIIYANKI